MALIVAAERGWVTRDEALARLRLMLDLLMKARCYHGALPHFMNGRTGETIPFWRKDDAADLVETSFLFMGLLCARQYFDRDTPAEAVGALAHQHPVERRGVELVHARRPEGALLALEPVQRLGDGSPHPRLERDASSPTFWLPRRRVTPSIQPCITRAGHTAAAFRNGKSYYGTTLPLGMPYGGPLFFTHYSFCGLDPRGLKDRHGDYWEQNLRHVRINRAHCVANPGNFKGYGESCWGLDSKRRPRRLCRARAG